MSMSKVIGELFVEDEYIVYETVNVTEKGIWKDHTTTVERVDWKATKDKHERLAKKNGVIPKSAKLLYGMNIGILPNDQMFMGHILSDPSTYNGVGTIFKVIKI